MDDMEERGSIFDNPYVEDLYLVLADNWDLPTPDASGDMILGGIIGVPESWDVAMFHVEMAFQYEGWAFVDLEKDDKGRINLHLRHPTSVDDLPKYDKMPWVDDNKLNAYLMVWMALANVLYHENCKVIAPGKHHETCFNMWTANYAVMRKCWDALLETEEEHQWKDEPEHRYRLTRLLFTARSHEAERLETQAPEFFFRACMMRARVILDGRVGESSFTPMPQGQKVGDAYHKRAFEMHG